MAHRDTNTHTQVSLGACDYVRHVRSGGRDVINLFRQETDACAPRTHIHTHTSAVRETKPTSRCHRETKPQKRRLALCDNPLTRIYIQGLEYASTPSASLRYNPPPASAHPSSLSLLSVYLPSHSPFASCYLFLSSVIYIPPEKLSPSRDLICLSSVYRTRPCMASPPHTHTLPP